MSISSMSILANIKQVERLHLAYFPFQGHSLYGREILPYHLKSAACWIAPVNFVFYYGRPCSYLL